MLYSQLSLEEYHARINLQEEMLKETWDRIYNELTDMFIGERV